MISISQRADELTPSATLSMTAKARQMREDGIDVISFSAGEPDFDTPLYIKDAAKQSLDRGFTKYTPSNGIKLLRDAISKKMKVENQLEYSADEITVTCGAKQAIANALLATIDEGDEVIVPAPYWVSYPAQVRLAGGKPLFVDTTDDGLKLTPKRLQDNLSNKTKALLLNSPSNPSGVVYDEKELIRLAKICMDNNIAVISDEIYEYLIFNGMKHLSIVNADSRMRDLTIIVNGVSKGFAMTGWRLGWAAGPSAVIDKMSILAGQQTTSPTSFVQEAAVKALNGNREDVHSMVAQFKKRRDRMYSQLKEIPGVQCLNPDGAFYLFPDMRNFGDDLELADLLLTKGHVATVAGTPFGAPGFLRLSFATSMENIDEGIHRLKSILTELAQS